MPQIQQRVLRLLEGPCAHQKDYDCNLAALVKELPLPLTNPDPDKVSYARKALHILTTNFLEGNEVLVNFSDGTTAIYEAEELEKLRPVPKQIVAA